MPPGLDRTCRNIQKPLFRCHAQSSDEAQIGLGVLVCSGDEKRLQINGVRRYQAPDHDAVGRFSETALIQ